MTLREAQKIISKPRKGLTVVKERFNTKNIINLFVERANEDFSYMKPFVKKMGWSSEKHLKQIYTWIYKNIRYVDDQDSYGDDWQVIKSPAQTINDGEADCKSLSLLAKSIIDNLDEPVTNLARFVQYEWQPDLQHVYLVAIIEDGTEKALDTVYATDTGRNRYGQEVRKIKKVKDYKFKKMPLAKLGTIDCKKLSANQNDCAQAFTMPMPEQYAPLFQNSRKYQSDLQSYYHNVENCPQETQELIVNNVPQPMPKRTISRQLNHTNNKKIITSPIDINAPNPKKGKKEKGDNNNNNNWLKLGLAFAGGFALGKFIKF